ncbi:TRAP transporter large permease [Chloroflexota bacterium]
MLESGLSVLILIGCLLVGLPIGFGFAVAVLFMIFTLGYDPQFLLPYSFFRMRSILLLSIPFFIIAGGIMEEGNITRPLIGFVDTIVTKVRGGLGAVSAISCAIFGAISGSAAAAISCIGPIMIPRMEEEGYPRGYATSLVTASAGIAVLIPPSFCMILYGWITNTSVTACFLAGAFPGVILTILFIIINYFAVGRYPVKKPQPWGSMKQVGRDVVSTGWRALPALTMPVLILGSIYGGVATPTEAAAVAAVYAVPIGFFVYRGLTIKGLGRTLIKSGVTIGAIMLLLFFAMMLGRMFIMEQVPQSIGKWMVSLSDNRIVILLMCNVIMIIFGMFMDDLTSMIIAAPLLLPVVLQVGVSPVHFAAIVTTNVMMGCYTPPMAPMIYLGQRIAHTTFPDMFKSSMTLVVLGYLPTVLITTYFPPIAEWLPVAILGERILARPPV